MRLQRYQLKLTTVPRKCRGLEEVSANAPGIRAYNEPLTWADCLYAVRFSTRHLASPASTELRFLRPKDYSS
jgi:hypothetical protein